MALASISVRFTRPEISFWNQASSAALTSVSPFLSKFVYASGAIPAGVWQDVQVETVNDLGATFSTDTEIV